MQLSLDAADRLVELVEERHGMVSATEAARSLFALDHVSEGLATQLLADVVGSDSRLVWRGVHVGLTAPHRTAWSLDTAPYVVFDLETTGLRPGASRICEIGAVRLRGLVPADSFTTLVDPGVPLPRNIATLTGLADEALRTAPAVEDAVERFLAFAGNCVLVAHNARFDLAFLHREVERLTGRRLAAPVLDTVWLARRLLAGRTPRASLASLAHFFGTSVTPCHRALPDAQATAEILVRLIGIAQEQGARTIEDLSQLAAPRARRIHGKRSLAFGAPTRPGVYLFRDRTEQVLYVGRARDLRARLRSYFRSERQRPAVEAALGAAHRIEWRVLGSELEAALEELRLIRELRPPANARAPRPERYVYFERRDDRLIVSSRPTELGPIKGRSRAARAARALADASEAELDRLTTEGPLPRLRARLRDLSESLRYEEAARLRDRISALESVMQELARLERLRAAELCLLVPAREAGFRRLFVVAGGRIAATRTLPAGGGLTLELEAALTEARAAGPSTAAEDADELLLLGTFLKRPPPELTIIPSTAVAREAKRLSAVPALA